MESETKMLMTLGKISTSDTSKYSENTIRSTCSHFRLLLANGINIESNDELSKIKLNALKNKHKQPLSDEHKYQIAMSLKRIANIQLDIRKLIKSRNLKSSPHRRRAANPEYMNDVEKIINRATQIVQDVSTNQEIIDLGLYFSCLSVLLTLATTMRINEITKLKLDDLDNILEKKPVNIKLKSKNVEYKRTFILSDLLISIIRTIKNQRVYVREYLMNKRINTKEHTTQLTKLRDDYLILVSTSYMCKKIKEISAACYIPISTQGFNMFRKYMTTLLSDNGRHDLAQRLNQHTNEATTINNYYIQSAQASEDAFSKIHQLTINDPPKNASSSVPIPNIPDSDLNMLPLSPPETPYQQN